MNKLILLLIVTLCFSNSLFAQAAETGIMRSNGKIYVVMAVTVTILLGLVGYVWRLDRKLTVLEKGEKGTTE